MSVEISRQVIIQYEKSKCSVPDDCIKNVDGMEFVKLSASGAAARLIIGKRNPSFAGTEGWKQLCDLRNDASNSCHDENKLFDDEDDDHDDEVTGKAKKKLKRKRSTSSHHDDVKVVTVKVKGNDIHVLTASHPAEALWVQCEKAALSTIFDFLEESKNEPVSKRNYVKGSNAVGMGSGRRAVKTIDGWKYQKTEKDD